jgi:hypothetical protein
MIHEGIQIPYNMKCATCNHYASDHWYSDRKIIWEGPCSECTSIIGWSFPCVQFKFDNLNYIEKVAERKQLI